MTFTITSFIVTSFICYGIYRYFMWHFKRLRLYKMARKFQGPPVLPLLGNLLLFKGNSEQILEMLNEVGDTYPSPFRLWLGSVLTLIVSDPKYIKVLFSSQKSRGKGPILIDYCRPFIGEPLVSSPVPKWKVHRKLIQPTLNTELLDSFVKTFAKYAKILIDDTIMEKNLDGSEFEIYNLMTMCTLAIIGETTMGVKLGNETNKIWQFVEAVNYIIASLGERFFHFWLHPDFIFYRTKLGREQMNQIKIFKEFTENIIHLRRKEINSIDPLDEDTITTDIANHNRRQIFLDLLLKKSNDDEVKLTEKEIRDHVNGFFIAGYETLALTITYAMLMLASHTEDQEKAYQELYEIYGEDDIDEHPVSQKDLSRMKHLERVIKETMRLFPVAPFIVREVTEDLDIGENCNTLPQGSFAIISILSLHRNEKYWPDPLKFDTNRFSPEEISKRDPYSFIPFSGGPRNCIGMNYAMLAMKTILATILRKFVLKKDDIKPIKDIRLKMPILLKPVDPIKMRIAKRIMKNHQ